MLLHEMGLRLFVVHGSHPCAAVEKAMSMKGLSYRVTESDPATGCTVKLTSTTGNARFFRDAEWRFRVEPAPEGSRVFCTAAFTLRLRYFFLAPILLSMKRAIRRDLLLLRDRLESTPVRES